MMHAATSRAKAKSYGGALWIDRMEPTAGDDRFIPIPEEAKGRQDR
jgi:hypothetical protein